MDTSGFCQVGRHGTLSLMKRQSGPGDTEDTPLASFGIDDDELTFGSSTTCGVRLYYSDVDNLHCKIVFDEFKVGSPSRLGFPTYSSVLGVSCHPWLFRRDCGWLSSLPTYLW